MAKFLFLSEDFCEFRFPIPLAQALGDNGAIGSNKDGQGNSIDSKVLAKIYCCVVLNLIKAPTFLNVGAVWYLYY